MVALAGYTYLGPKGEKLLMRRKLVLCVVLVCLAVSVRAAEPFIALVDEERGLLLIPDGTAAEVRPGPHRDAWRLDGSGAAAVLAARLGDRLGTGATFDAPYWMEAPLWQKVAPTLICGPSGGGLHAVDEWVDLDQVRRFTRSLIDVLSTGDAQPPATSA